jgi:hypothetical protein
VLQIYTGIACNKQVVTDREIDALRGYVDRQATLPRQFSFFDDDDDTPTSLQQVICDAPTALPVSTEILRFSIQTPLILNFPMTNMKYSKILS